MGKQSSFLEFQAWFPDEESCIRLLMDRRWPDGFLCPKCGGRVGDLLKSRAYTYPIFATDWGSPREFDDSGREFPRKCAVPVAYTDCSAIKYI